MKKNITSLFLCLSVSTALAQTSTNGQSTLPNIIPPSAESYKLGTFGNIPVSLFTGNANVNIPLTSYETKNIKLPITLSYSSNGVKVDDMNGSTGLNWTLNAGGVITRIIRDLPDEDHQVNIAFPSNIDDLGATRNPAVMQFFQDASSPNVDTEQDFYMANFNGIQIKFVFDKRGVPVIYSQKDVIIEGRSGGDAFTITTDDGTKYYFTDKERTSNRTAGDGHSLISIKTTAWYLTKIEDTVTGEAVFIENTDGGYSTTISQSQTLSYTSPTGGPMYSSCGNPAFIRYPQTSELISHNQIVNGKQIKRIYSNNPVYGEILFDYMQYPENTDYKSLNKVVKKLGNTTINNIDLTYNFTGNKRLFLTSVKDNISKALHQLEYINPQEFPVRLAFSRDSWGYYNGIPYNTNLIPALQKLNNWNYNGAITDVKPEKTEIGMLKKIIYPTKGSSEFFYENHTKIEKNVVLIPERKNGVQIGVEKAHGPHVTNTVTFKSVKNEEILIGGGAWFNYDACDPAVEIPGKHRAVARLKRPNGDPITLYRKTPAGMAYGEGTSFTFPLVDSFYAMIQKDEEVTLSLTTLFVCVQAEVGATYTEQLEVRGDREVPIGGLRISKIIDNTENGAATTRKFVYKDLNEQTSEAEVVRTPEFEEQLKFTRTCTTSPNPGNPGSGINTGVEQFPYYAVTSSNINQLYATHPNVFYKTVQEIVEGKSNIIHKYSTDTDVFGNILYGNNIRNSQWTNAGWNNGRETFTKYLDGSNNLVRTVEMNYVEDPARKYQVDGFSIRKNYDNPVAQNVSRTCTADDVTRTIDVTYCTASHSHHYRVADWYKNCYAPGANNVTQQYKDICYGKAVGEVIAFDDYLDNLDIMQYKNISYFEYLKSQKTTDYLNGKEMKAETEYFYNNPHHTQLNKKKTTYPDLSVDEASYQYAHEKGNQLMIDKNMVSIPMETTVTQTVGNTTKILSKTETLYPSSLPHAVAGNLVLPLSLQSYDTQNPSAARTEVTYDRYDDKGNILQYTTKDGVPVSIVWGYNKTRPIIKIEGIPYSHIENMISPYIADSDADALDPTKEPLLLLGYQRLRKDGSLTGRLITTYSYDPLIGVTSITPPSGIIEKYIYDAANRLQKVEDANGKIIKEYQYHYKN